MYRLQQSLGCDLPTSTGDGWTITSFLAAQTPDFFRPRVEQHASLSLEYNVLCTQLLHDFFRPGPRDEEQLTRSLLAAQMMAELLTIVYRDYLDVPREVMRLRKEQQVYHRMLALRGYHVSPLTEPEPESEWFIQRVREFIASSNWLRLFSIRAKRVLNSLVPLTVKTDPYVGFMGRVDMVANPFFAWLSWLFFIPRLFANLAILFKHLVEQQGMSNAEKALGWQNRLLIHLKRRWFELGNDAAWLVFGLLGCFVLIGSLAPVASYMNMVYYVYDVVLAVIRYVHEMQRMDELQAEYRRMMQLAAQEPDPNRKEEMERDIEAFQHQLTERHHFEKKRLLVSVCNTVSLCLGLALCLPFMAALHPIFPVIGAFIILATTVSVYYATRDVERQRPVSDTTLLEKPATAGLLARLGLFTAEPKAPRERPVVLTEDCLCSGLAL